MAPKLSGIREADRARHEALVELADSIARELLAPEGRVVIKLFSDSEEAATGLLRRSFGKISRNKPATARKGSSELYAVAGQLER